jgi:hypothetical protein
MDLLNLNKKNQVSKFAIYSCSGSTKLILQPVSFWSIQDIVSQQYIEPA